MHSLLPEWVYARLKRFLERANRAPVPALTDEARALVTRVLRMDIQKTEDLLQADLSHWRGEGNASSSAGQLRMSLENPEMPDDPTSSSNSHPR